MVEGAFESRCAERLTFETSACPRLGSRKIWEEHSGCHDSCVRLVFDASLAATASGSARQPLKPLRSAPHSTAPLHPRRASANATPAGARNRSTAPNAGLRRQGGAGCSRCCFVTGRLLAETTVVRVLLQDLHPSLLLILPLLTDHVSASDPASVVLSWYSSLSLLHLSALQHILPTHSLLPLSYCNTY